MPQPTGASVVFVQVMVISTFAPGATAALEEAKVTSNPRGGPMLSPRHAKSRNTLSRSRSAPRHLAFTCGPARGGSFAAVAASTPASPLDRADGTCLHAASTRMGRARVNHGKDTSKIRV